MYVAGYFAPHGHYPATPSGLASGVVNAPLSAISNSLTPDGVFSYTPISAFPNDSFQASNYFVDVDFEPAPAQPTGVSADGAVNGTATVSWTAPPPNDSSPLTSYTITPYAGATPKPATTVPAGATHVGIGGLNNGIAYTFTVAASNSGGEGAPSEHSNVVTPKAAHLLDVATSADGTTKVTTAKFTTEEAGERLFAFVATDGPASGTPTVKVTGGGVTWTLVNRSDSQRGDVEIWAALGVKKLKGKTVSASVKKKGFDLSLTVISVKLSKGAGASAAAAGAAGAPSVSLNGSEAGSAVFAVGVDPDGAIARTPLSGQTIIHQDTDTAAHKTFWVQQLTQALGARSSLATLGDSAPASDRWNMAAVEVLGP